MTTIETDNTSEDMLLQFRRRRDHDAACALLGDMLLTVSDLEHDVSESLRGLIGITESETLLLIMDILSFKQKLDALRPIVMQRFARQQECILQFNPLHRRAHRMRIRRNAFLHARWDAETGSFEFANPSRNPLSRQWETSCSLPMLHDELEQLTGLIDELRFWRERWGV